MLPKMNSGLIFAILILFSSACDSALIPGYYMDRCVLGANIEKAISDAVTESVKNNKGLCAGIIRLHFHDCFVQGCDGSVLLTNDGKNPKAERFSPPNLSLRGFEVIDDAKKAADKSCGQASPTVSCADVLAFAARDCVQILGDFSYIVPAGRLDSRISIDQLALDNLPRPTFDVQELVGSFEKKGLDKVDLVTLSGDHSVGVSHCSSFEDRLNPIKPAEINQTYAETLKDNCTKSDEVPQDYVTPNKLDRQWFTNGQSNQVLFFSDWDLRTDTVAESLMKDFATEPTGLSWQMTFMSSMQKMGQITDPSSGPGEIRKICSAVNAS